MRLFLCIARLLSGQMLNGPGWAAADAIDAMQMLTDTLGTDRTPEAALVDNVDGTCSKRRDIILIIGVDTTERSHQL